MGYPAVWGGCTAENPRVAVPGSGAHFIGGTFIGFRWMHLAEIVRPAETTNIGEGLTIRVDQDGIIFMAHGCEGASRHFDGQNMVFLDGHARFVHGNPERRPTFSCGPATIGDTSYANCLCAQLMTYDH
jgi:prepilin-type processing-associated H-X9-DG protein